jgi:glutathione S-transferase
VAIPLNNYDPWFMKINPKGEVPVLQDDNRYIPDSQKIVEHLEKVIPTPCLIPDTDVHKNICSLFSKINVEQVLYYCINYPDNPYVEDMQMNALLLWMFRSKTSGEAERKEKFFNDLADKYPEFKEQFMVKKQKKIELASLVHDFDLFKAGVEEFKEVFKAVENKLKSNADAGNADHWLCGEQFTCADIETAVALRRMEFMGLSKATWNDGSNEYLVKYHQRLIQRDSYKKVCMYSMTSMTLFYMKVIAWKASKKAIKYAAFTAVVAGVGYGIYRAYDYVQNH